METFVREERDDEEDEQDEGDDDNEEDSTNRISEGAKAPTPESRLFHFS